jgi:ferrochelatase
MIGVLLINLGTPDAPETPAVRKYLREFLSDPRVIDISPIARTLLVNAIIVPFRSPKSAEAYRKIWLPEGSPLLFHTKNLAQRVSEKLGSKYAVAVGMRYGRPSIASAMEELTQKGVQEIRVLPLFPQYATSSFGSAVAEVYRVAQKNWNAPLIKILPPFFDHPGFIEAFAQVAQPVLEKLRPDHVLFSFHGLPERHILKGDPTGKHCLKFDECCDHPNEKTAYCYRAQSFKTALAIKKRLGIPDDLCGVSFQSRLGRTPWLKPYTDLIIPELVAHGKKRIAVFCPAFVADCLETLEEIGIRARESALTAGAEELQLVPSLNDHPVWVEAVCKITQSVND